MSALGRALLDEWGGGRKSTYTAKGWHAMLSKLTSSPRGYDAANAAGLDVTPRTLLGWLAEQASPSAANQRKIREAYDRMAGGYWDPANETRPYRIVGEIDSGDRVQNRALVINPARGDWQPIREAYERGELTEEKAEEMFIEHVIEEDIGEGSGGWGFPGGSYTV